MPLIDLQDLVRAGETEPVRSWLAEAGTLEIVEELTRLNPWNTALVFRLLPRAEPVLEVVHRPQGPCARHGCPACWSGDVTA